MRGAPQKMYSLKILDPSTVLSDWLLTAFTAWLAWRLLRQAMRVDDRAIRLWFWAFCAVALAAGLSGAWHAFAGNVDATLAPLLWTFSLVLASAAGLLFLLSTLRVYVRGRALGMLAGLAVAKFALFAIYVALKDDFRMLVYDSALTLLIVLGFSAWGAWARRVPGAAWVVAGVLVCVLGAFFQGGRVSIHRQLSYNELWHLLQMGAMYLLFRGGLLLREQGTAPDFENTQPLPFAGKE